VHDALYAAARGGGASLNASTLRIDAAAIDPARQLLVAIPSARHERTHAMTRGWVERHVVRSVGCAAIQLVMVATGQIDAGLTGNSKLWDIAAGALIVVEAGGRVTRPDGGPLFPLDTDAYAAQEISTLAGRVDVHERLLREAS
jgi:myo-inositol-1(or 4)-monophosphatase